MSRFTPTLGRRLLPLAGLALLGACATTLSSPASLAKTADRYSSRWPATRSSDFVGPAELSLAGTGTAYDVLQRLRPQFFVTHASAFSLDAYGGRPVVYVDGMRLGGVEELRNISSIMLEEVRFLSPVVGSERFGRYHAGGVIAVSTHR